MSGPEAGGNDALCPDCGGEQGHSVSYDDDRGVRHAHWVDCATCKGSGRVEVGCECGSATGVHPTWCPVQFVKAERAGQ